MEDPDKPAVYEGESFRSGYSRAKKQWQNYTTKSGQNNSFMYHHTNTNHNGIIGPNKGSLDYKFQVTDTFKSNLSRQSNEGVRQTIMEKFQTDNKVTVLNSKIDFCQPFRTNLTVINKLNNINIRPGELDNQIPMDRQSTPDNNAEPQSSRQRKRRLDRESVPIKTDAEPQSSSLQSLREVELSGTTV